MSVLTFPDAFGYADLVTIVRRARTAAPDGAIRLQSRGASLGVWAEILGGSGLFAEGAAIGMRGIALAQPVDTGDLDVVVASAALADRFAREGDRATFLSVPPTTVHVPWAGITGALSGWAPVGALLADDLVDAAELGIAEIAAGAPESAGSVAVQALRSRVWVRLIAGEVPAGAAFAAYVLGFVRRGDDPVEVYRSGRWVRLRLRGGQVLAR